MNPGNNELFEVNKYNFFFKMCNSIKISFESVDV